MHEYCMGTNLHVNHFRLSNQIQVDEVDIPDSKDLPSGRKTVEGGVDMCCKTSANRSILVSSAQTI
jgi:hypothetical protein